ncbi:MAG: FtsL-like putative cell division protein [Edaphocola sp.]
MDGNKLYNEEAETVADIAAAEDTAEATIAPLEPLPAPANRWGNWRDLVDRFSYKGIVSNMPYLMFLTLLCILYITNNNRAISLTRSINEKGKELKELRWRYMDVQSRLMYQTSETQLVPKAAVLGLKPLDKPAFEIKIKVPAKAEE